NHVPHATLKFIISTRVRSAYIHGVHNNLGRGVMTSPSSDFVQSVARGLMVIRSFGATAPSQTRSQGAAATGLSRAAARRFLRTFVEEADAGSTDGRFAVTPRVRAPVRPPVGGRRLRRKRRCAVFAPPARARAGL